jgi:uncharacterized protein (TIRG00374 family)
VEQPEHPSRLHSTIALVLLAGGAILFASLVWRTGPASIAALLMTVKSAAPALLVPYIVATLCEAGGWRFAFPPTNRSVSFADVVRYNMAAKAFQQITPSVSQASELIKIHLLRRDGVSLDESLASVIISKISITLAEVTYAGLGLLITALYMPVMPEAVTRSAGVAAIVASALLVAGIILVRRNGLLRPVLMFVQRSQRFAPWVDKHGHVFSSTDSLLANYLHHCRARFSLSGLSFFLAWATGAAETWLFLHVLGMPVGVFTALLIHVWLMIAIRLTAFVPGNVGTAEAATVMIFSYLHLSSEGALAFALLRRMRQLFAIATGLAVATVAAPTWRWKLIRPR